MKKNTQAEKKKDNILKWLRLNRTEKKVMQGEGKKIPVKKPLSTKELAEKLNISPTTLRDAESVNNIECVSLSTLIAYRNYFHVPISTLLGELEIYDTDNLHINKELGLSDSSIATIKGMSPIALSMLNIFVGKEKDTEAFLYNLADITYSIKNCLEQNGNNKNDIEYQNRKKRAVNLFMEYMHTFSFKDFRKILQQIEKQYIEEQIQIENQMNEEMTRYLEDFYNSNAIEEYEQYCKEWL